MKNNETKNHRLDKFLVGGNTCFTLGEAIILFPKLDFGPQLPGTARSFSRDSSMTFFQTLVLVSFNTPQGALFIA
jgi:hypothetical protein